jgi:hypothetical protein
VRTPAVLAVGPIGFLDAAEPDRRRWLAAFRALLDGLEAPLQVLIHFGVGGEGPPVLPASSQPRRAWDLEFARRLAGAPGAQRRLVHLATLGSPDLLERALGQIGVPWLERVQWLPREVPLAEGPGWLHDQEGWHRTWFLERFPGGELSPGWLLQLVPPGLRVALSWHADPLPTDWVLDQLRRRLVRWRASQLAERQGAPDPRLASAISAASSLQRRLAEGHERTFSVGLYVTVTAPSRAELKRASAQFEAAARATLCSLEPCTFRQRDGRLATLPLVRDRLRRRHLLDTSSTATLIPWFHAEVADPGGLVVGRNRATGQPVLVDPFDATNYQNANIAVFGHSGAGKTHLLSVLAMGALGVGVQVWVIDPEDEYGELARQLGGQAVPLAPGSGHSLNVLDLAPAAEAAEQEVVELCSTICGGLDEVERSEVTEAARVVLGTPGGLLADLVGLLRPGSRVTRVLRRWAGGELGQLFGRPTTLDLEASMVAFGLRGVRGELLGPVYHLLAHALWARIRRRERRRLLILDELGLLFDDPGLRRFVVGLARRLRKYDAGLVFATQNAGDLLATEEGEVVATNPAILFLGAQRPRAAARLQRAYGLSAAQRAALEAAGRGDFLLCAGTARLSMEVVAPPWQAATMARARGQYNAASVTVPRLAGRADPLELALGPIPREIP